LQRRIVQEVHVNGLDTQPLQAALDTAADRVWREVPHASHHIIATFRTDDDLIAIRALFEESTDHPLAVPLAIRVRRINKIHPSIDGRMEGFGADGVIHRAIDATDGHGAKTHHRYIESCPSKRTLFHS